jgi:hypothetical protein
MQSIRVIALAYCDALEGKESKRLLRMRWAKIPIMLLGVLLVIIAVIGTLNTLCFHWNQPFWTWFLLFELMSIYIGGRAITTSICAFHGLYADSGHVIGNVRTDAEQVFVNDPVYRLCWQVFSRIQIVALLQESDYVQDRQDEIAVFAQQVREEAALLDAYLATCKEGCQHDFDGWLDNYPAKKSLKEWMQTHLQLHARVYAKDLAVLVQQEFITREGDAVFCSILITSLL